MPFPDNDYPPAIEVQVSEEVAERFYSMCQRKRVAPAKMLETMVRSFDRGNTIYDLGSRIDFGKYSGMIIEDLVRTDTRYMRWLANTSEWFKLSAEAERLLKQMEA